MIRILDRMVAGAFMRLFIRFVVGAPLLFVLGDVTEKLDDHLDRGVSLFEMGMGYLYMYPHYMLLSFPIAGLVAAVFTVHSMTTHSEIVAAKGGGISFHRLILPLGVMGAVLTSFALYMSDVVPVTNRKSAEWFKEREVRKEWRQNFVYQTKAQETLSVQRLLVASGSMERIVLEVPENDGSLRHVWAEQAFYTDHAGWTFHQGYLRKISPQGAEITYAFDRYRPRHLDLPPEELLEEPPGDEELTYAELGEKADAIYRSGGNPNELLVKKEQKLAIPAATMVIILFGAPLATTAKRGGAAFGIGASLGSTILYMMLLRVFGAIGSSGGLPAFWAAWLPNMLFFGAAVLLLSRVRT
ncbi:MAG: LptF/LptG family permease [Gemmatimonadota bacterium]|nr:LptF/LptG family permease [Gemmatimonadota bacterium]